MKKAFTLAEVLITLGIIGVVAALTIPSLIEHYKKQATVAQLKKAYSNLNQAIKLSEVDNGEYKNWSIGFGNTEAYFNQYYKPYLKPIKMCQDYRDCGYNKYQPWYYINNDECGTALNPSGRIPMLFADGTLIMIMTDSGAGDNIVVNNNIYVDLNGPKKPNTMGKDLFIFERTDNGVLPLGYDRVESTINQSCSMSGWYCAAKIIRDGWEIKDSYPWK